MNQKIQNVSCPKCATNINVEELLYKEVQNSLQKEFDFKTEKQILAVGNEIENLKKKQQVLDLERKKLKETVEESVASRVAAERKKVEEQIRKQIVGETEDEINAYKIELQKKSNAVKDANKIRAELEKTKRDMEELEGQIRLENEEKLSKEIAKQRKQIQFEQEQKWQMKLAEQEKKLEDTSKQLKEAQRKMDQGSVQMQGEVMELAIQNWLQQNFPTDSIEEIGKGVKGGDCLQTVKSFGGLDCGTIYYESKRTKEFQKEWIPKFKADMIQRNAFVGVLITEVMPKDMVRLGQKDGVWICTLEEFKSLCFVLRESLILLANVKIAQENKGEKMTMLYDFLTGHEFRMEIEALVEGFTQMNQDLETEKRAMEAIWKRREKQIKKVILNTTQMYGSVRGIAGDSIKPIALLELTTK